MSSCTSWSFLAWLACALSRLIVCVRGDGLLRQIQLSFHIGKFMRKPLEIAISSACCKIEFRNSFVNAIVISLSGRSKFLSSVSSFSAAANCLSNFLERACSSSSFSRNCCSACEIESSKFAYFPRKGWVCGLRAGAPSSCTATGVSEIGGPGAWSDASDARFLAAVSC
ncbi:hypothetical protein PF005_g24897 [Phytophthora fragariae]|uniref:Secreted protein n=1 Tax=Phytophthora fragariae TaxID=53985 RepID=A0A6A3GUL8_9STRA|nr:hypothetical protein PF003_g13663 [Phytophthora fragariae]KAE8929644.1 hypothetical protein PF009_g20245 [Phytophthora fragariae]KAE8960711.1 hypothetical protein PF011_g30006 [Phytophthora fragariae]KAE9089191.1 hypothetical protein PF010_g19095 [Phytophthora fragariae]KAE9090026.1 hypothetical protein PF007_g19391 [Phytophthora fragariae]